MWVADHCFGFFENKYGQCNALMNFSKEHFKCIENNHETYTAILKYCSIGKYIKVFMVQQQHAFLDYVILFIACHQRIPIINNRSSKIDNRDNTLHTDCAATAERAEYVEIFEYCEHKNTTWHNVSNSAILQHDSELSNDAGINNENDDIGSEDSNLQVILCDVNSGMPSSNNDNSTAKAALHIDIKSIITRDLTQDSKQQFDWKKLLLYPSILSDYVTKHQLAKKVYFGTISFLKTGLSHCAMIMFTMKYNAWIIRFCNIFRIASKICDVLRSIKILSKCLTQHIGTINDSIFKQAIDCHLNHKNWCKWANGKWCIMTVAKDSRTSKECAKKLTLNTITEYVKILSTDW